MADYLDRNAVIDALYDADAITMRGVKIINTMPRADVRPAVRGAWLGTEFDEYADGYPVYSEWQCSVCEMIVEDEEPNWNFCPNCGADMRGDADGVEL